MEKTILYYSNNCPHSKKVVRFIKEHIPSLFNDMQIVNVDNIQNPEPIPKFIDRIPMLEIIHNNQRKVYADNNLRKWLIQTAKQQQQQQNIGPPQPSSKQHSEMTDPREANQAGLMEWSPSDFLTSSGLSDSYSAFNPKDDKSNYKSCSDKFVSINSNIDNIGINNGIIQPQINNNNNNYDYNQSNREIEKQKKFEEDFAMKEMERKELNPKKPNQGNTTMDAEAFNKMWMEKQRASQSQM